MTGELISQETIDALIDATNEARDTIRLAHEATRDLRQVVVEARTLIRTETTERVREELQAAVKGATDALAAETERAMDAAVDKVGREFSRLERLFRGLENDGRPSMETLIRRVKAR